MRNQFAAIAMALSLASAQNGVWSQFTPQRNPALIKHNPRNNKRTPKRTKSRKK